MAGVPDSIRRRRVFVDSSAYLALLDRDDAHHSEAVAILQELAALRYRQLTTNVLVMEAHARVLSYLGAAQARAFLASMTASNTAVVRVRHRDEVRAMEILFRFVDKDFSFVDAVSFAVIERLVIPYAFTFDDHFRQFGLTALAPGMLSR